MIKRQNQAKTRLQKVSNLKATYLSAPPQRKQKIPPLSKQAIATPKPAISSNPAEAINQAMRIPNLMQDEETEFADQFDQEIEEEEEFDQDEEDEY